jgi:hypothetical protein
MSSMTFAINDTNGIQSDKFYAIEICCTIRERRISGPWDITEPMPIISGPYDSVEDAADSVAGEIVEEIVGGSCLVDMIQTGNLKGVEVAFMI